MTSEELWQRIKQGMGYTDEEIEMVKATPYRRKALEAGPQLVRRKIVAEVVEAKNCAAHPVGAKYVVRSNGVVRPAECSPTLCIDVLALLRPIVQVVFDRIAEGQDPQAGFPRFFSCPDVGVECGGFGKAIIKVTVE